MPFRNRNFSITKSDKHELAWSQLAEDATTNKQIVLAQTVDVGAKTGPTDCAVGSHVKGIYLEFHFSANIVTNPKVIHWTVEVLQPGMTGTTSSTYYQDKRSFIIQRGMEMLPKDLGTVFKRIIFVKIPKLYQRRKQGDFIVFRYISTSAELINACGIAIYKEKY